MNKATVTALVLALLVLALLGSGTAGYMCLSNQIDIANTQTKSAEIRVCDLEKEVADLSEAAQLAEERGRELSTLRNQTAELEKQVAELRSRATASPATNTITWQLPAGVPPQAGAQPQIVWGLNGDMQNAQVREAIRRVQLDANGNLDGGLINLVPNVTVTAPRINEIIDFTPPAETTARTLGGEVIINGHLGGQTEQTVRIRRRLNIEPQPKPDAAPKPKADDKNTEQF